MASQSQCSDINILSWNIHGLKAKLNNEEKKKNLLKIISKYDIVLLQETRIGQKTVNKNKEAESQAREECIDLATVAKAIEDTHKIVELKDRECRGQLNNQGNTMYLTYFSSRRRGVAIIVNKPHKRLEAFCRDGDYAWVYVEIGGQKYTFMSVYYHSTETDDLMNEMSEFRCRSEAFQKHLVIGGDFNTSLNPDLDVIRENRAHEAQRERLRRFMRQGNLSDVWRRLHGNERQYTFSTADPKSRLDYIFMLEKEVDDVQRCEIDQNVTLSDHFPVTLTLRMPAAADDDDAVEELTKVISEIEL